MLIFSIVRVADAVRPTIPAIKTQTALGVRTGTPSRAVTLTEREQVPAAPVPAVSG